MDKFPLLLVATEFGPNASGGGPAVVRQMLRGWPDEKLAWWSCLNAGDASFAHRLQTRQAALVPQRLYPDRRFRSLKSQLLQGFWVPWSARHLQNTVDRLKPDVIWCIPHAWSIPPLGQVLLRGRCPAYHVSIHDYATTNKSTVRFGKARTRQWAATVDNLYFHATTRDAISQPMLDDLRLRTGRDGTIARAGLEPQDFQYLANKVQSTSGKVRIAYAGTIISEKTFALFVESLRSLRSGLSMTVILEFFSAHSYRNRHWFDSSWMIEHGHVSELQLAEALKSFTWGFVPMSLSDEDPNYNRFSLPTKLASYLAAGLPVITMGHRESSIVRLSKHYNIGVCITSAAIQAVEESLANTLSIREPWNHFRTEIQRCARAEFDAERMREVLYQCFGTQL